MPSLTPSWVAQVTRGRLQAGPADAPLASVTTDSRTLGAGDLFVALKGPRFDGHRFVADVLARGAGAAIVARGAELGDVPPGGAIIEVDDPLHALQALAHATRLASGASVVAITGSAGKTTTKEAIAECLATRFRVVRNKGNLNNHIGLPLSLMALRSGPDIAVMELGMNHPGEISRLVLIAEPNVRVWTNVGDAHLGFFTSPEAIADAKAEILERADASSVLVCNADDARVMARVGSFPGTTLTFGVAEGATVRATRIEDRGLEGTVADVTTPAGNLRIETALVGLGNTANLLAATAVAVHYGVPLDAVAAVARRLSPAPRRGAVQRLPSGVTIIDDSYNSSPAALRVALRALAAASGTRKLAVLGEMLELGAHSVALHRELGAAAAASGVAQLVTVGGAPARALADAAIEAGLAAGAVWHFATSREALDAVADAVRPGDVVLVKGSRGIATDLIVDRLAAVGA